MLLVCVSAATASASGAAGSVKYKGGTTANPPYLFITISHGHMTRADFSIRECGAFVFDSYTDLVAPVTHGRIAWRVHYQDNGPSPLASENIYTTFIGKITGNTATLTLRDKRVDPSSTCTGVHTYHLRRTTPPSGRGA